MTIIDRYKTMNKSLTYGPENEFEKLIWDCFDYEIFKLKPTKKHKEWFKHCFDVDYPVEEAELTKKLIKELKSCVKIRKKDREFEEKMANQRKERGFSDQDAWSIRDWFLTVMPNMLQQMRDNLHGYPDIISQYPNNSQAVVTSEKEKSKQGFIKWQEVIDRMIFLLKEMNEETCSFKNKYQEDVEKATDEFHEKYGWFGDKFEELNSIKPESKSGKRIYFYYDDPSHPEWIELNHNYYRMEQHKWYYMNECREEFFNLFSRYFWNLWD